MAYPQTPGRKRGKRAPGPRGPLATPDTRYPCPECGRAVERLPTGRMRAHGSPRACPFPGGEALAMATPEGRAMLTAAHPEFAPVYDAVRQTYEDRAPRAHGGQLRHPDPRDPGWRWKRQ